MKDIIQSQHIQRRSRPFRPSPALKLPAAKKWIIPDRKRFPAVRAVSLIQSRLSPRSIALLFTSIIAVTLFIILADAFMVVYSVKSLPSVEDTLFLRDMRAYVGLSSAGNPSEKADQPPLDLSETFRFERYTVKTGDSISSIAARHSLTASTIIAANGIKNAKRLNSGAILKIPNMDGMPYSVRKGDSLSRIAAAFGIPMEAILDANDLSSEAIRPGMSLFLPGARLRGEELRRVFGDFFVRPVIGRLSSGYGWRNDPFTGVRRFHAALDFAAPTGTPIRAAMAGRVSVIGYNSVYGKYIILSHSGGYQTWYAHLSEYRTVKGARIDQGELIGDVGSTGYSTGSHLHFAVYKNDRALNPLTLLSNR